MGGRYLIGRRNYSGNNKDYKTYGKKKPVDEIGTLATTSQFGSIFNLAAWDLLWLEVIDRWEMDALRAWQNRTNSDNMCEFLETLGEKNKKLV